MQEKVSIIIPVYNCEKYLEECIKSIINKKYNNLEIIIVNDGSTDSSIEILNRYKETDERIILINKKNEGVSIARNTGMENATSEWIMFVDSDDTLEKDAVENFAKKIDKDIDIIFSNVYCLIDNKKEKAKCIYKETRDFYDNDKKELIDSIFYDNERWKVKYAPTPFAKLYRKKFLQENKICFIENLKYGEDRIFNFLAFNYAKKIVFIENITYNYRIHSESVMKKYDENLIANYTKLLIEYKRIFIENSFYEEYKEEYNFFVLRQFNKFFNNYFFDVRTTKQYKELKKEFLELTQKEPYKEVIYKEKIVSLSKKRKLMIFLIKTKQFYLLKLFYKLNKRL